MLSLFSYLCIIGGLIYWVQRPGLGFGNSIKIQSNPAHELEEWLKRFHWGNRTDLGSRVKLPQYKFYTDVIETILNLARKMGGNYQESLLFLRERLQSDRQFEKKIKEAVLGTWLQMTLMMVLTWGFITGALLITEVILPLKSLVFIFGWQILGLTCLPFLVKYFRQKYFGDIGELWKMLYILSSLARVPLARSEIMALAQVQKLNEIKTKALIPLTEKLRDICKKSLREGGSYEEEIKSLMDELRFQEKWHFELFEKRLLAIKLALLSLFFLPSYLGFVFLLLGQLLTAL